MTVDGREHAQPEHDLVPTGAGLAHQTFIFGSYFPQVAEGRCGYAGSNKAISVERDSVRKEQLLEPLALVEGRLHPQVGGARQNAFCDARMPLCRVLRAGLSDGRSARA
jgi:hypothetical protein